MEWRNVHWNIILQEFSYAAIQVIKIQFSVMHTFRKLHRSDEQGMQLSTCS